MREKTLDMKNGFEKKLFIIGNGFDCAHGLKTSYDNFYKYLSRKDASLDEQSLLDLLTDELGVYEDEVNKVWSDLESLLGMVDFETEIEMTSEYYIDQNDDNTDKDTDYYDYQVIDNMLAKQFDVELLPSIFASWISTIDVIHAKPKGCFMKIIQGRFNKFLTFNYTRTLENIYNVFLPMHIHGSIDEYGEADGILVGHGNDKLKEYVYCAGDRNPLGELSSCSAIEECQNRARDMCNAWRKDVRSNLEKNIGFFQGIQDMRMIYSYGFSYGDVDMPYIKEIVDNLREQEKVQWFFESYNEVRNISYEKKIRGIGFKGGFGRFSI